MTNEIECDILTVYTANTGGSVPFDFHAGKLGRFRCWQAAQAVEIHKIQLQFREDWRLVCPKTTTRREVEE